MTAVDIPRFEGLWSDERSDFSLEGEKEEQEKAGLRDGTITVPPSAPSTHKRAKTGWDLFRDSRMPNYKGRRGVVPMHEIGLEWKALGHSMSGVVEGHS